MTNTPSSMTLRHLTPVLDEYRLRVKTTQPRVTDTYARDPFRLADEGHVKIFDLESQQVVTMNLWPHQRETISEWIDLDQLAAGRLDLRNLLEEKSRQMGESWLVCYVLLWLVGWWPFPYLVLKMKEREVDDGGSGSTPESLFGRIRFMWENLPAYLRPPLDFKYLLIRNLALRGARIVGEGATADPGRGGRYKGALVDEAARMAYGEAAHAALGRACPTGRFYLSTPHGEDNVYFRLRKQRPSTYRFLIHHWSIHPVYGEGAHIAGDDPQCARCAGNRAGVRWSPADPGAAHRYPGKLTSPWYDNAVLDMSDEDVAAELDIDYAGSLTARVYPGFDERVHVVDRSLYDPDLPVELAFDYGVSDPTSVVVLQDAPDSLRVVGEVEVVNQAPEQVYDTLVDYLIDLGVERKGLAPNHSRHIFAVGDPAGEAKQLATGRPLVSDYRRAGLNIQSKPSIAVKTSIMAVRRLLVGHPKPLVISSVDAPELIRHMKAWRWPVDRQGNVKAGATQPNHDEHSHANAALRYYVAFKFPPPASRVSRSPRNAPDSDGVIDPSLVYDMAL